MKKILFVSSEVHPLIKTGGLADVCGSLPKAIAELSQDIKLILPRYQAANLSELYPSPLPLQCDKTNQNVQHY